MNQVKYGKHESKMKRDKEKLKPLLKAVMRKVKMQRLNYQTKTRL